MTTKKRVAASRRAKRMPRYTSGPKKGQFKPRGAKSNPARKARKTRKVRKHRKVRHNPVNTTLAASKKTYAPKRRKASRKASRRTVATFKAVRKPKAKKASTYKVTRKLSRVKIARGKRAGKTVRYYRYSAKRVSKNPNFGAMLKQGAMLYGGLIGMRAISGLLREYVVKPYQVRNAATLGTGVMAQVLPVLPAAAGVLLAGFAPKFIKNTQLVNGLQMGAVISAFDALYTSFIKPKLMVSAPAVANVLGLDDVGYGAYVPMLGEYTNPPPTQQIGADVTEAMALDEYVQGDGLGLSVNEALADSEVQGFQTGYAAGSLSRTLFSS